MLPCPWPLPGPVGTVVRSGGRSAAAEELAQPAAPAGGRVACVAGATLRGRDAGHYLLDVLAAAGPRGLAAFPAGDCSAHGVLLEGWVRDTGVAGEWGECGRCLPGRVPAHVGGRRAAASEPENTPWGIDNTQAITPQGVSQTRCAARTGTPGAGDVPPRRRHRPQPGNASPRLRYTHGGILSALRTEGAKMSTVALTEGTFEETVARPGITLVDWWASWCGPCRMFAPVFAAASEQAPGHHVRQGRHRGPARAGRGRADHLDPDPDGLPGRHPGLLPARRAARGLTRAGHPAVRELDMDEVRGKLAARERASR